ncbi:diphosphomevalonate/mevalonate 3,5-bisphosphate decarboxylase family protein [Wenyingzhuangia aestuarii]|uniref:diphosphomevalonate/mevalonate 3,5-bisphosphate decarboxylase family protein n=1 Tax=Wenyingzhuangia aestuarii TaxID=1647582 RepID=UPI00143BFD39|nr:diphosphomevalonate decarboxylase [Wenyingzhuangia aestuarii]NJB82850.1 diphosphomevalonate decarboxylase [Wenyingzhuangia aestuarii]
MEQIFIPKTVGTVKESGTVTWQTPSNIALVKYWGKRNPQLPENTSVSFTLSNCHTKTTLSYNKKQQSNDNFDFDVVFEGKINEAFKPKIETFFKRIEAYVPFLKEYTFVIESQNSFPHSSGIASSASGMSAIAMCLMSMEKEMNPTLTEEEFYHKASFLARLGSGSACRSVKGEIVVWGAHPEINGSSDLYGVEFKDAVAPIFQNYQDTILLVDKGEKQVSSTVGHDLMHGHPFSQQRFAQAQENISKIKDIFAKGAIDDFIALVESEALTLHAMMMTSHPYFILMKPNTLEVINKVWDYRKETGSKLCFTLDAGANVHLLYPKSEKETVQLFIKQDLAVFCKNGEYIHDQVGMGANKLT